MSNNNFFFLKIGLDLHWGYAIRHILYSKTRDSYLLPPPTTIIGALSYGYARVLGLPEELYGEKSVSTAERLRERVVSVNVKINAPLHHYSDLNRIWWFRVKERKAKFDSVALGKVYTAPHKGPSIEAVLLFEKSVSVRDLIKAAYSISRLGCKEGVVSVRYVKYGYAEPFNAEVAETRYSFWYDVIKEFKGDLYLQQVVDYRKAPISRYVGAPLRLHAYPYSTRFKTSTKVVAKIDASKSRFYKVDGEVIIVEL